jgi:hypothetical protein
MRDVLASVLNHDNIGMKENLKHIASVDCRAGIRGSTKVLDVETFDTVRFIFCVLCCLIGSA